MESVRRLNALCVTVFLLIASTTAQERSCGLNGSLLLTEAGSIIKVDGNGQNKEIITNSVKEAVSLDYDCKNNVLYWADLEKTEIFALNEGSSKPRLVVPKQDQLLPFGIALDTVSNKLYVGDVYSSTVRIFDLKNKMNQAIVVGDLREVRSIAIDVNAGYLFILDRYKILRTDLDGANRKVLLQFEDYKNVDQIICGKSLSIFGILIDNNAQRLYWMDAFTRQVESSNYDGQDRKVHFHDSQGQYIYESLGSLALLDGNLYWSDVEKNTVFKIETETGKSSPILDSTPLSAKAISCPVRKSVDNPCANNNGHCEHLCILSKSSKDNYICACSIGYDLAEDKQSCIATCDFLPFSKVPVELSPTCTGNTSDPENRLDYFREDLGVNLYHWHWHLVFPYEGPINIVDKDRRGELFYYMHRQILARYNVERLGNRLNLVKSLLNWDEPIEEAYFPMLNSDVAGKDWPGRAANMRLSDIDRPDAHKRFTIDDMRLFKERLYEAVYRKKVTKADGEDIDINNDKGIDILGHMIESDMLTPNVEYYGNIHNMGHMAIAFINDPQFKYHQNTGVMAETSTAMRDPIFYRWHAFLDGIFIAHKNSLSPYDTKTLDFSAVKMSSVEVRSFRADHKPREDKNTLHTFMMKSDISMSRGLDFVPRDAVLTRITHLNHEDYEFKIDVINKSNKKVRGTVRIFIAPETGFRNYAIDLMEQKELMIEIDRFVVELEPVDKVQTIIRKSSESSITIPFEQTFRSLDIGRPNDEDANKADKFNYCGCGWPDHVLLPKGTRSGYPMVLFAMISNYDEDKVNQENKGDSNGICRTGVSLCGLQDKKYPDKRPMGFPFDRPVHASTLKSFLTSNMASTSITIVHSPEERQGHMVSRDSRRQGTRGKK